MNELRNGVVFCGLFIFAGAGCLGASDSGEPSTVEDEESVPSIDGAEEGEVSSSSQNLVVLTSVSVGRGSMKPVYFNKVAGRKYTVCLNSLSGNPDLYGHYTGVPSVANYQFRSVNGGSSSDCFSFTAGSSGPYYLGVYGSQVGGNGVATANVWVVNSNIVEVPSGFSRALVWPLDGYRSLVNSFSDFNSPWGNNSSGSMPFFPGYSNYVHSGVDVSAAAGASVRAMCDGVIVRLGSLGYESSSKSSWGYYVGQECSRNGNKIAIAYDHLNSAGRPVIGSSVVAGQVIGSVFDLQVPGEGDHLHLAICRGSFANCSPQSGAIQMSSFPGKMINPWIGSNPGLYR